MHPPGYSDFAAVQVENPTRLRELRVLERDMLRNISRRLRQRSDKGMNGRTRADLEYLLKLIGWNFEDADN